MELLDYLLGVQRFNLGLQEFCEKFLKEGTVKDLHLQYVESEKVPSEVFDKFMEEDPSGERHKYLAWMLKQYVLNPERGPHIVDVVSLFDKQVRRKRLGGEKADIYKFDLEGADSLALQAAATKTRGEEERETKEQESEIIQETDRYLVVLPKTYKASCFYGAHTKWCVSGRSVSYWESYWRKGHVIYVVIDKKENKKYAVDVAPNGSRTIFDEEDKVVPLKKFKSLFGVVECLQEQEDSFMKIFKPINDVGFLQRLGAYQNPDGTWTLKGRGIFDPKKEYKYPILSRRYNHFLRKDAIESIPPKAPSFSKAVSSLEEMGVEWVEFSKVITFQVDVLTRQGYQAVGIYEDKIIILETKVGDHLRSRTGFLILVSSKDEIESGKVSSVTALTISDAVAVIRRKLGVSGVELKSVRKDLRQARKRHREGKDEVKRVLRENPDVAAKGEEIEDYDKHIEFLLKDPKVGPVYKAYLEARELVYELEKKEYQIIHAGDI